MDNDTHLSSSSLFHYTPTLENLKGILRSGFKPSYSLERIPLSFVDDHDPQETELMSQARISEWVHLRKMHPANDLDIYTAMVSFCDIPVHLSRPHAEIYGSYAIALSKRWAEDIIGLNPILYMSAKSHLMRQFNVLWTRISLIDSSYLYRPPPEHFSIGSKEEIDAGHAKDWRYQIGMYNKVLHSCRAIAAHVKLYEGPFSHGSYQNPSHRFYDEREWRYLPPNPEMKEEPPFLEPTTPKHLIDHFTSELAPLPIDFRSVTHLLVTSEDEKQELRSYLRDLQLPGLDPIDLSKIPIMRLSEACQQGTGAAP